MKKIVGVAMVSLMAVLGLWSAFSEEQGSSDGPRTQREKEASRVVVPPSAPREASVEVMMEPAKIEKDLPSFPLKFDASNFVTWTTQEVENRIASLQDRLDRGQWVRRANLHLLNLEQMSELSDLLQEISTLRNVATERHLGEAESLLEEL